MYLSILLSFNLFARCFTYGPWEWQAEAFKALLGELFAIPLSWATSPFSPAPLFFNKVGRGSSPRGSRLSDKVKIGWKIGRDYLILNRLNYLEWGRGMKESKIIFLHRPREEHYRREWGSLTGRSEEPESGHVCENTNSSFSFFCARIPIHRSANLSVSPSRSPYMCELSHWYSGSSVFEWSPD